MKKIAKKISALFIIIFTLALSIVPLAIKAEGSEYYVVGSFNSFQVEAEYKMEPSVDKFSYTLSALDNTQFYITDKVNSYKTLGINKGLSFLIKNKGDYEITFNPNASDNSYVEIKRLEAKDYYLVGTNGFDLTNENKLIRLNENEYELKLEALDSFMFYITDGEREYHNPNGGDYLIERAGKYIITFKLNEMNYVVNISEDVAKEKEYYILGSFNNYKMSDSSRLTKIDDGDEYYYILDNLKPSQFYISDGENEYRDNNINFILDEFNRYKIYFNPLDTYSNNLNVRVEEVNYYLLNDDNGFTINDSFRLERNIDNENYLEYYIELDFKKNSQFRIGDGFEEFSSGKGNFIINALGRYKIYFSPSHLYDGNSNIRYEKIINDYDYYILGSFNNYEINEAYKMNLNEDNLDFEEYVFIINNKEASQLYIKDSEDNIYDSNGANIILNSYTSYKIYFSKEHSYSNGSHIMVEELSYYVLSNLNGFTIDDKFIMVKNLDNKKYLEYSYSISVKEPVQFVIGNGDIEYSDNEGKFLIMDEGKYVIYFSLEHTYENNKNVIVRADRIPDEEYYIVGSFNNYELDNIDYRLEYDLKEKSFNQFTIELELKSGDSFYIYDGKNKFYSPNGDEIVIPAFGKYIIYFSKDHDYGNGYNIYYKEINDDLNDSVIVDINNKEDLLDLIAKCNDDFYSNNLTVNLMTDLDLAGATISPIQIFNGIFNGNYHKIGNFILDDKVVGNELGFIRRLMEAGEINNLILDYDLACENSDTTIGGIAGISYGKIRGSKFYGRISGTSIVGGISGSNEEGALIINSFNYGSVSGKSFIGGISGLNRGEIRKCSNYGKINDTSFSSNDEKKLLNIGGITGFNNGYIYEGANKALVGTKGLGSFIGGISGSSIGVIESSFNAGKIIGRANVGGICGYYGELKNKKEYPEYDEIIKEIEDILKDYEDNNKQIVAAKADEIKSSLRYCYNIGTINALNNAGGIAGYASTSKNNDGFNIEICYNTSNIVADYSYAGGIVGEHGQGIITDSFNTGIIEASSYAGGICGSSEGTISNSFNISTIKGTKYVGGISGYGSEINNTYAIADIYNAEGFVGGISGYVKDLDNVYNNYFSSSYKGIDNINYSNKAMEVEREKLAASGILNVDLDNNHFVAGAKEKTFPGLRLMLSDNKNNKLSKDFYEALELAISYSCSLTFTDDDGEIISILKVEYGKDFDMNLLPKIPKREGYYSYYDKSFDGKAITKDMVIMATYVEKITSIATDNSEKPLIIAEGEFYPTVTISVADGNNDYLSKNSKYNTIKSYKVYFNDSENPLYDGNIKISYRIPDNIKNPIIGIVKDNNVIIVDSKISGGYIKFDLAGANEFVLLSEEFYNINNRDFVKMLTYTGIGLAALIGGGVILTLALKNKKKSKAKA